MPMRLRFALHGTRHNRIFHLVAVEQGKRRDAKPAELLGIYNRYTSGAQNKKTIEWSVDRIRYWLQVGAVPSKSVVKLLELVSPIRVVLSRLGPDNEHQIRETFLNPVLSILPT